MQPTEVLDLQPVDRAEVIVLVDNASDSLSSRPSDRVTEMARFTRRGGRAITGASLCLATHGLGCLLRVERAGRWRTILFDTGPDGEVLAANVQRLGAELGDVEVVVLSHGHWDHAGGLLRAVDLIRAAGGPDPVPVALHPEMFHERGMRAPDGAVRPLADIPSPRSLRQHGAEPVVTTSPLLLCDGQVAVSGEIPRVTDFERGLPGQVRRVGPAGRSATAIAGAASTDESVAAAASTDVAAAGATSADTVERWEPDELLSDERYVAVHVAGAGLVVLSACSHAGIVNVLTDATRRWPEPGLHTVLGGLHLSGANERIIPDTVAALAGFAPRVVAPGHCTGWRAVSALHVAFGEERLVPLAVGQTLSIGG